LRRWQFVSELPTAVRDGAGMGVFLQISAPQSLMKTYRVNLISAESLSLDSTFKQYIYKEIKEFEKDCEI
jgi:hypothetical protein